MRRYGGGAGSPGEPDRGARSRGAGSAVLSEADKEPRFGLGGTPVARPDDPSPKGGVAHSEDVRGRAGRRRWGRRAVRRAEGDGGPAGQPASVRPCGRSRRGSESGGRGEGLPL